MNTTINHTITFQLTREAMRSALLAGHNGALEQTYPVPADLVPALLDLPNAYIADDGEVSVHCTEKLEQRPDDALQAIGLVSAAFARKAEREAKEAAERAARDEEYARKRIEAWDSAVRDLAQQPVDELAKHSRTGTLHGASGQTDEWPRCDWHAVSSNGCHAREPGSYLQALAETGRLADYDARRAELDAEKAAKEQAAKDQQRQYAEALKAAVDAWGNASQKARQVEGVLPIGEAEALVRDKLFAPLAEYPRYQRLTLHDVPHDEGCFAGKHQALFSVDDKDELTELEYEALVEVRTALQESAHGKNSSTVTVRCHSCDCSECDQQVERSSVLATVTWHGRQFSREYAVAEG